MPWKRCIAASRSVGGTDDKSESRSTVRSATVRGSHRQREAPGPSSPRSASGHAGQQGNERRRESPRAGHALTSNVRVLGVARHASRVVNARTGSRVAVSTVPPSFIEQCQPNDWHLRRPAPATAGSRLGKKTPAPTWRHETSWRSRRGMPIRPDAQSQKVRERPGCAAQTAHDVRSAP